MFSLIAFLSAKFKKNNTIPSHEDKLKYEALGLYDWLLRCHNGSTQLNKLAWVHVTRKNNIISVHFTTHEDFSSRAYDQSFIVGYDDVGLVSLYYQVRNMHLGYDRENNIYNGSKHMLKVSPFVEKLRNLFVAKGEMFYFNTPVSGGDDILVSKEDVKCQQKTVVNYVNG
jgi:hypothetical protein